MLKNEILNLKQIIKSYEDQSFKLVEMEKKLKSQNIKHEKDIKALQEKYIQKIKKLNTDYFKKDDSDTIVLSNYYQFIDHSSDLKEKHRKILQSDRKSDDYNSKFDHYKKLIDKKIPDNSLINKV